MEAAFDAQEASEAIPEAAYQQAINEGLQDLPAEILAEIADFVYFVRKRSLELQNQEQALDQALAKAGLE